jgi:mRNA interferase MazF
VKILFVKRGDIFFADLSPVVGSEQDGLRPVLVVQNDFGNKYSPTVIVLPITSKEKTNLPTHIPIDGVGLKKNSYILTEQIRTLDKSRLKDKIGSVDVNTLNKVKIALKISLNIRMNFQDLFYDW